MRRLFVLCTVLVLAGIGQVKGEIYNARQDFSGENNPNGVWSYGYSYILGGGMTVYPDYTLNLYGEYAWHDDSLYPDDDIPHVTQVDKTAFGWPIGPDQLIFHPGWEGEYSIIRWTAPEDGICTVDAGFEGAHLGEKNVFVYHNADKLYEAYILDYAIAPSYNSEFSVMAGDTIDFAVGKIMTAAGTTTACSAMIEFNPIPEPSTIVLLVMGAVVLLMFSTRK